MTNAVAGSTTIDSDELLGVLVWRFRQFCNSGFEIELATTLAARIDVDLHEALDLVAGGCPPETAARILL